MGWRALLLISVACVLAGCGDDDNLSAPSPASPAAQSGFVSETYLRARQLDYLHFATQTFSPGDVLNVVAHMTRARLEPGYHAPGTVPANAWDGSFAKMAALEDTRDFDALYLLQVLLDYRNDPLLPPELVQKLEDALTSFKLWFTEPTPDGLLDNSYYWTENHELLYHTIEYLVGQLYPDRALSTDRRSGREHLATARERLLRWFDLRARFGFFEWFSNVYYQKDLTPLLTLVEFADDEEIRTRAAQVLDLLLFDMAVHTFRGAFGVTHGRSYKKDKMTSLDDDTWGGVKLLFDSTTYPYQSGSAPDATLLARARRYRPPEAVLRVARAAGPFVDQERIGIDLDETAPIVPSPDAPYEFSFSDPADLTVWWSMGALTAWQVVPLTLQTFDAYNLWETTNFLPFAGLKPLTHSVPFAQNLARSEAKILSFGLLRQVDTYTYRTPDYMLSAALDYRKGSLGAQQHSWQVTFDANALIFTNHPVTPPVQSTVWGEDNESSGGYWTGEASMPRSAQYQNVAIHIYNPQYPAKNPAPFDVFTYQPYTHAYVPQDHFDEVVQEGSWTFGRFGDGYFALYSYRPTTWLVYDPQVIATNGMVQPFDLRADGGPDNVWIVECGRRADWQSFAAFRAAVSAAAVTITRLSGLQGFDVAYESPSQGHVTFGWQAPFTVQGRAIAPSGKRFDNPWSLTDLNTRLTAIAADGFGVRLDFAQARRDVFAPGGDAASSPATQ